MSSVGRIDAPPEPDNTTRTARKASTSGAALHIAPLRHEATFGSVDSSPSPIGPVCGDTIFGSGRYSCPVDICRHTSTVLLPRMPITVRGVGTYRVGSYVLLLNADDGHVAETALASDVVALAVADAAGVGDAVG